MQPDPGLERIETARHQHVKTLHAGRHANGDLPQALAPVPSASARASADVVLLIGSAAVAFSALYFATDVIELLQGGFSTVQLALTYAAEAAIPLFVLGLYALQRPRIGRLGLVGALAYAYTFVFFTSTVVYALVDHTRDWDALTSAFGEWMTIHSALMVIGGIALGVATVRARVLPRWTGAILVLGMILMTVATALPDIAQTFAAGVRDLAFAGMGAALLREGGRRRFWARWTP
jgi:hypothetical protein